MTLAGFVARPLAARIRCIFSNPFMANAKKNTDVSDKKTEDSAATDAAPAAKRHPVKVLRVEDCSASIWAREYVSRGQQKTFFSVSFERSYKDHDGWRYTKSFDLDSLGKLMTLCRQAEEAIRMLQQEAEKRQQDEESVA